MEDRVKQLEKEIDNLKMVINQMKALANKDNFSAVQVFRKSSDFKTTLKIPSHDTPPTTCIVGEIIEDGGVLKICSATDTWTVCGTQT